MEKHADSTATVCHAIEVRLASHPWDGQLSRDYNEGRRAAQPHLGGPSYRPLRTRRVGGSRKLGTCAEIGSCPARGGSESVT